MNLPSITGMTQTDIDNANQMKERLLKRFEVPTLRSVGSKIFEEFKVDLGITMNKYTGKLKQDVEISEFELSMVLDDGFSYFGGDVVIHPDRKFFATIYID